MVMQIKEWQQGNLLNITLRGHFSGIPNQFESSSTETTNTNDIELLNNNNYSLEFDSFYAPFDMVLSTITIKSPFALPSGVEMNATIINGSEIIDTIPMVQNESENIKTYGTACSPRIWEDDYIRIVISFNGDYNLLTFNSNNVVISITGCVAYDMYSPSLFADEYFIYNPDECPTGEEEDCIFQWIQGYDLFKTNIKLQNRSGNEIFTYNSYIDEVKASTDFLIQGFYLFIIEDELIRTNKIKTPQTCFYVDILINNKSITEYLGLDRLIELNTETKIYENYTSLTNNNIYGYPITKGDIITLKLYTKKRGGIYNGKIIECTLYGCSEDCASIGEEYVNVYERCEGTTECEWKYTGTSELLPSSSNTIVSIPEAGTTTTPVIPSRQDRDYVTLDGQYVTINGQKIWV